MIKCFGSMSIVGAGFPEFRSIAVFGGVFLLAWKKSNLWHGKQTFKHVSELLSYC